jgi:hypothetical protein
MIKAPWAVTLTRDDLETIATILNNPEITHWDIRQARAGGFECWLHHEDISTWNKGDTMKESLEKTHERFKSMLLPVDK